MNLTGKACIAGVMGWPVAHSRSPACHGYWLAHYGVDGAYVPLPVRPENLETALRALPLLGFAGVNVTVPHKEAALAIVDEADALATRIGAVNTVSVRSDGGLVGTNTDGFGFLENLHHGAPSWRAAAGPAVVLGAGGAARAIVAALLDAGAPEIRLVNRTATRAENLRDALAGPIRVESWAGRADALAGASLLVNATTLGMTGGEGLDLDLGQLPGAALVTDIVYAPLETPLLMAARGLGHPTVDGLGMLLHQARPGWRMWFSGAAPGGDTGPIDPEVTDALRTAVLLDMAR
ncbi:MAG: shikimate dehydrogenase [Rhodospirillaceae bacterium]|nr:MAG: shikimate dehydrogenase [Rhodospirillaceae bacterium]